MKNSKVFLGLAAAGLSFTCGAFGDEDVRTALIPMPEKAIEHVVFEKVRSEDEASDHLSKDCCGNRNADAYQELLSRFLVMYEVQKREMMIVINAQQFAINLQQEAIIAKDQTITAKDETIAAKNQTIALQKELNKQASRELGHRKMRKPKFSE